MRSIALQNYYLYSDALLAAWVAIQLLALLNIPATAADSNKVLPRAIVEQRPL